MVKVHLVGSNGHLTWLIQYYSYLEKQGYIKIISCSKFFPEVDSNTLFYCDLKIEVIPGK
jgi:hypothetical protein